MVKWLPAAYTQLSSQASHVLTVAHCHLMKRWPGAQGLMNNRIIYKAMNTQALLLIASASISLLVYIIPYIDRVLDKKKAGPLTDWAPVVERTAIYVMVILMLATGAFGKLYESLYCYYEQRSDLPNDITSAMFLSCIIGTLLLLRIISVTISGLTGRARLNVQKYLSIVGAYALIFVGVKIVILVLCCDLIVWPIILTCILSIRYAWEVFFKRKDYTTYNIPKILIISILTTGLIVAMTIYSRSYIWNSGLPEAFGYERFLFNPVLAFLSLFIQQYPFYQMIIANNEGVCEMFSAIGEKVPKEPCEHPYGGYEEEDDDNAEEEVPANLYPKPKRDGDLWGYYKEGRCIVQPQYIYAEWFDTRHEVAVVGNNGKKGLIDKTGRVVLPIAYTYVYVWKRCILAVEGHQWVLVKPYQKKEVIPLEYDSVRVVSERILIVERNHHFGLASTIVGELLLPVAYDRIESVGGFPMVALYSDGSGWQYFNYQSFTMSLVYEMVDFCAHSQLLRVKRNGLFGFVNEFFHEVLPVKREKAWPFSEGYALVTFNGVWHYVGMDFSTVPVDTPNREHKKLEYEVVRNDKGKNMLKSKCSEEQFASFTSIVPLDIDGLMSFNDFKPAFITPGYLPYNNEEYLKAYNNGRCGILDATTGEYVLPCEYDDLQYSRMYGDMAYYKLGGLWGIIDLNTRDSMVSPQYSYMRPCFKGVIVCTRDGMMGAISIAGETIIDFIYSDIYQGGEGEMIVTSGYKKGILGLQGETIVDIRYDDIKYISMDEVSLLDGSETSIYRLRDRTGASNNK